MSLYIKSFFLLLVIVSCSSGGHTKDRGKDYFVEKCITLIGKNFQDIPMVLDVRFVEESEDWRIDLIRAPRVHG